MVDVTLLYYSISAITCIRKNIFSALPNLDVWILFVCSLPQVFRSKLSDDAGQSFHQPKTGSGSAMQHGAATLGRNTTSKVRDLLISTVIVRIPNCQGFYAVW